MKPIKGHITELLCEDYKRFKKQVFMQYGPQITDKWLAKNIKQLDKFFAELEEKQAEAIEIYNDHIRHNSI